MRKLFPVAFLAFASCLAPSAHAAESYDNCSGTIASVPVVIATQGVWCMKGDLNSAVTSGNVITIAANNVTIDCNGFKLGGLLAGAGTSAVGIRGDNRLNVRVRNCQIRGFSYGLILAGGGGHLVEDNQFDGNRSTGIFLSADASMIRRNLVVDTGGAESSLVTYGILVNGRTHVVDNTVDGVTPSGTDVEAYGIYANDHTSIVGNRVAGVISGNGAAASGIRVGGSYALVKDNFVYGGAVASSTGISCFSATTTARENSISESATGVAGCYSLDNVFQP